MKKKISIWLVLILVLFCGCNQQPPTVENAGEIVPLIAAIPVNPMQLSVATEEEIDIVFSIKSIFDTLLGSQFYEVHVNTSEQFGSYVDIVLDDNISYARTNQDVRKFAKVIADEYDTPIFVVGNPIHSNVPLVTVSDIQNAAILMPSNPAQLSDEELTAAANHLLHLVLGIDFFEVTLNEAEESGRALDITLRDEISHVSTDEGVADFLQQVADGLGVQLYLNGAPIYAKVQYVTIDSRNASGLFENQPFSDEKFSSMDDLDLSNKLTVLLNPVLGKDFYDLTISTSEDSGSIVTVLIDRRIEAALTSEIAAGYIGQLEAMFDVTIRLSIPQITNMP